MPDAEKVAAVRSALPAVGAGIYFNTPVAGPLPAESAAAMAEIAGWELRTGRAHRDRADDVRARVDEARAAIAAIVTADLDTVSLAHGHSDAFSRAVRGVEWRPGDAIVAPVEDPELADLRAAVPPGVEWTSDVTALASGRAKLVALPLVSSSTGERLPVEDVAATAHAAGARVLVDASLAIGAIPVDPSSLGADIVVARAESWLLGPEGLAVVVGPAADEVAGGIHLPSVVGLARGCGWLSMYVGLPWIHDRGAAVTTYAAARLGAIDGVDLLTPESRATTLAFRIRGWDAADALDELGARIFLLASAVDAQTLRIGLGFWTTEEEIDRLVAAVSLLAASTPDTLPQRPRLTILGQDP
jgi:selenocysteine lyase/cysteine desulfurase